MRRYLEYSFFLSLLIIMFILFFRHFFAPGYPKVLSDSFGHLFKVWKIWKFGYGTWAEEWYTGYPFERFYPPLSYLLGAAYAQLANSDVVGYKLATLTAMLLSPLTAYWATRKMGMEFYQSAIVAVFYTFSTWNVRIPIDEGGYARFLAVGLAPLLPLAVLAVCNSKVGKKALVAAGLLVGVLIVTHNTFFVTTVFSSLLIGAALLVFKVEKWEVTILKIKKFLFNIAVVGLVAFAVASFWLVPFVADLGYSSFRAENNVPALFQSQSNNLGFALTIGVNGYDVLITYHALIYHAIVVLTPLVALVSRNRRLLIASSVLAVSYWMAIGLSLGANGPFAILDKLPGMALVPANRWLDAISLTAAFQAAFLIKGFQNVHLNVKRIRGFFPLVWAVLLILPALTVIPYVANYSSSSLPNDLLQTLQFIKVNTQPTERFYQYGLGAGKPIGVANSIIGYAPVLADANTIDGWYRQGDPLDQQRIDLYWCVTEAPGAAKELLDAYNVKHVILNSNDPLYARAYEGLTAIGFKQSFALDAYRVMSTGNTSYAQPVGRVLAVGDEWVIRSALESSTLQVTYLGSSIPGNFSYETTRGYDVVVLQAYNYENENWTLGLKQYVEEGGIVVVDPYKSPDQNSSDFLGLGVNVSTVQVNGPLQSNDLVDHATWSANYSWEGGDWGGCTFQGAGILDLLEIGGYSGVGTVQLGKGQIVLVGIDMIFHGLYTQDLRNISFLVNTIHGALNSTAQCSAEIVSDGHIRLEYSSSRPATIRVSETWFPHWDVHTNGTWSGHPEKDPKSGVIMLQMPSGTYMVDLVFNDPFLVLRLVSLLSVVAVLVFVMIPGTYLENFTRRPSIK